MPHVHVHAPEVEEHGAPPSGRERVLELAAVLLLSVTTLATAWSGYQAARWSGEQSQRYASKVFDDEADALYRKGSDAKTNDDKYILSTVFFAAVLFFAGISLRLDWRPLRLFVLGLGAVMLLSGVIFVLSLPTA